MLSSCSQRPQMYKKEKMQRSIEAAEGFSCRSTG